MIKTRTTVKDVAKLANVSTSTVSRVISDHPRISKETKERVLKIMDELNFRPNQIARSLARNATDVIGVIIPYRSTDTLLNPFFPEALRGIIKSAKKSGYDVLVSSNSTIEDELLNIKSFIHGSKVDGIVLMSSRRNDQNIKYLKKMNFPFSVIGTPEKESDVYFVDNDNERAAFELTKLLIEMGRKNLLFASGESTLTVTQRRCSGFCRALESYNIAYTQDNFMSGSFDEETGTRLGDEIAKMKIKPDGIISTDDVIAYGIVKKLLESGIKVPNDIAVASFNNSLLSRYSEVSITSVDIKAYELGREVVNSLVELINLDKNMSLFHKSRYIDYEIIKRDSTNNA